MGKLNFNLVMRLQTEAFKKGMRDVQNEIRTFRNSLVSMGAALGAGLGFTELISKMKDTVKNLSVAKATLENVSNETKDAAINTQLYANNLDFANRLAKKYHQNQIEIIDNFAQFHAACASTNISLEDQQKIYESLTRATAYFHMSESRARDMMIAITQMMSKGKVSSEELRRQLGNALPGAFNMMAEAIGVSTAELEKLLKAGKLASGPALIKFAEKLNEQTKNISFDSVQLKLNDLENAWIRFTDNTGFEEMFKRILDWGTKALDNLSEKVTWLGEHIDGVVTAIKAAFMGLAGGAIVKGFQNAWSAGIKTWTANMQSGLSKVRTEMVKLKKDAQAAVKGTPASVTQDKATGKLVLNNQTKLYGKNLTQAMDSVTDYNRKLLETQRITERIQNGTTGLTRVWTGLKGIIQGIGATLMANVYAIIAGAILGAVGSLVSKMHEYNKALKESAKIEKERKKTLDEEANSYRSKERLVRTELAIVNDVNRSESERIFALNKINEQLGLVGSAQLTIKDGIDKINAATEEWLGRLQRGAKLEAYTQELGNIQVEADKAKKKLTDALWKFNYRQGYNNLPLISERDLPNIFSTRNKNGVWVENESAKNNDVIRNARNTSEFKDLKLAYNEWKGTNDYLGTINENVKAIHEDMAKNGDFDVATGTTVTNEDLVGSTVEKPDKVAEKYAAELKALDNSLKENRITQDKYNSELIKLIERYLEKYTEAGGSSDSAWYKATLGKYNDVISYVKELEDLKDINKVLDNYTKAKMGANSSDELDSAANSAYGDIIDKAFDYLKAKGIDTSKMTVEELMKAFIEAVRQMSPQLADAISAAFKEATGTINRQVAQQWGKIYNEYGTDYSKRDKTNRDRYRGYKETNTEKYNSNIKDIDAEISRKQEIISKLQTLADNGSEKAKKDIDELKKKMEELRDKSEFLEQKATYSEYLDYIDDLKKKIMKNGVSAMKDFAEAIDRASSAWSDLNDVMTDEDSTWFDKIQAMFNYLTQTATTFMTLASSMQQFQETMDALNKAKKDEKIAQVGESLGIDTGAGIAAQQAQLESAQALTAANQNLAASEAEVATATATETAADATGAAAKEVKAVATKSVAGAETAAISSSAAATAASTAEGTADSVGAAAKIGKAIAANPLIGLALAATVAAGVAGIVSSLKKSYGKFATGGIVGYGTSQGDNTIARVNKGEMILNNAQQRTLFDIANGKAAGTGNVEFKIRGADLVGTLNNYTNRRKG